MSDKLQFLIEFLFRRNRNGLNVRRNGEYRRVNVQEVDDEDLVPGKLMSETFWTKNSHENKVLKFLYHETILKKKEKELLYLPLSAYFWNLDCNREIVNGNTPSLVFYNTKFHL